MLSRLRHLAGPLAVQIVCGLAYGLCFPPNRLRFLAWIVLVPALINMRRARIAEAALLAAVLAFVGALATADWLPRTIVVHFGQSSLLGWVVFLAVTLLTVMPPYAAFGAYYRWLADRLEASLPLAAAAAWVVSEFIRAKLAGGNPWVLFGYSQTGVLPVIQLADVTGIYGVSFAIILVNLSVAELWIQWRAQREWSRELGRLLLPPALAVLVTIGYGVVRLTAAPAIAAASDNPSQAVEGALKVAVIQGNLDPSSQSRPELHGRNLDVYLRLSLQALRESHPQLIVWPESALTFFLEHEPHLQQSLASVLVQGDAQLIAGGPHTFGQHPPGFHNSAYAVAPNGRIMARYDKERLMPFAEYSPLRAFDHVRRDIGRRHPYTPGTTSPPLPAIGGSAGILIGSEAFSPDLAARRVARGARYLVNLSDDTWIGDEKFSLISFDMAIVRAIEQRRYVVRASTSGPSAIIDPNGRVQVQSRLYRPALIEGRIVPRDGASIYASVGDAFAVMCGLGALVALAIPRRRRL